MPEADDTREVAATRVRRAPPRFLRAAVKVTTLRGARLVRVTLAGPELGEMEVPQPAGSVRLLLPSSGADELIMPVWDRNIFRLPGGGRPVLRTLTPVRFDPAAGELDVEIVLHGSGVAADWARVARPGDPVAVSGPARGYTIDPAAPAFVLAGDETAFPAIGQIVEQLPPGARVEAHLEVGDPAGRVELPGHPNLDVTWHVMPAGATPGEAMAAAVETAEIGEGTRVFAAGEAAAVQRIRRHLFDVRGLPRAQVTGRGYWKHGRSSDNGADDGRGE